MKILITISLLAMLSILVLAQSGRLFNVSSVGLIAGDPVMDHTACTIVTSSPTVLIAFAEATADAPQTNPGIVLKQINNNQQVELATNDDWTALSSTAQNLIKDTLRPLNSATDAALVVALDGGSYCVTGFEETTDGPAGTINVQINDASAQVGIDAEGVLNLLNPVSCQSDGSGCLDGAITTSLTVSRTAGVAPLAVFFDATATVATTVNNPFSELHYAWNFGDGNSGNWRTDRNKNTDSGPVAAHVFEWPGNYTVTLIVRDTQGNISSDKAMITVQNPDQVFSGPNTICFSTTSAFQGCPNGAQQITTSDFDTAMSYAASGTRLLFNRGENWQTVSRHIINTPGPGIIGAYGNGEKPSFHILGDDELFQLSGAVPNFTDWRFMDFDVWGSGENNYVFKFEGSVKQVLMLRLYMHDLWRSMVGDESPTNYYFSNGYAEQKLHDAVAIVDSIVENTSGNSANISAQRLMVLGNTFQHSSAHVLRVMWAEKAVINHNYFHDGGASNHLLKLHAPAWQEQGLGFQRYSENIVLSTNIFQGTDSAWSVTLGPQDDEHDERLRNILVEKNILKSGSGTQVGIRSSGQDSTIRNNIFDLSNGPDWIEAIAVSTRGIEPEPLRTVIYHNAAYSGNGNATLVSPHSDTVVKNNLVYAPVGDETIGCEGDQCVNNLTIDPSWVAPQSGDFRLQAGSSAIGVANTAAPVIDDFIGNLRAPDSSDDVGPFVFIGSE